MIKVNLIFAAGCVLAICTVTVSVSPNNTQSPCTGSPTLVSLPHPRNCSQFYICVGAQHFLLSCSDNMSWQPEKKTCVHAGSLDDICPCENRQSGGIFRHPTSCAQYYNCSTRATPINRVFAYPGHRRDDYLDECYFPQLFSMLTGKCENYTQVDCGRRIEEKNPCEYLRNQCTHDRCTYCRAYTPDCTGLPDGPNGWRGVSPYYIICQNGRLISQGFCTGGIFHPTQRRCVYPRSYFENQQ